MELQVINPDGQVASDKLTVADETFAREFNEALVHQVVVAYLAGARSGTRAQKNRSQVSGGGAKPWRQKGMGRARAGSSRSPIWRSGGVTFAARPQDHSQKVNKKMYRSAMRSILSELLRQERLTVASELMISEPKTKSALQLMAALNVGDSVLFVSEEIDNNFYLSVRNLPKVDVCSVASLNPNALLAFDRVVVTKEALEKIGEWLA